MSVDLVAPSAHGNLDEQISQLVQVATATVLSIKNPSSPTSSFPPISRRSCLQLQQHCRCCSFFHHQPPQPRYLSSLSTASNGNPRLPDSLHYIDPSGRPNAYQRAILEVGGVLQFYDFDKKFPAWGFGARPIDGPVSHCFNLNGSSNYCEVEGIHGIMTAYTSALFNVSLAGPTLFGHVVTQAAQIASGSVARNERKYFVLLIITDGVITDLQETKDAFVMASDLPLSILIVGVGGADFKEMEILDADKGERLESSSGRVASRDIVQFVPFRDVQSGEGSVVQSLLAELPTQFLTYVQGRGIGPTA